MKNYILILMLLVATLTLGQVYVFENGAAVGRVLEDDMGALFVQDYRTGQDRPVSYSEDGYLTTIYEPKQTYSLVQKQFSNPVNVSNKRYVEPVYNQTGGKTVVGEVLNTVLTIGTFCLLSRNQGYGYGNYGYGYNRPYNRYRINGFSLAKSQLNQYYIAVGHYEHYSGCGHFWR